MPNYHFTSARITIWIEQELPFQKDILAAIRAVFLAIYLLQHLPEWARCLILPLPAPCQPLVQGLWGESPLTCSTTKPATPPNGQRQHAQLQWHQHNVLSRLKEKLDFFLLLNQLPRSSFKAKVELRSCSTSLVQHSKAALLVHDLTARLISRNASYNL